MNKENETKLFTLAKDFLIASVWDELDSSNLFAIQLPWMNEPVIVSIIGEKEEERGLLIYRSLEELSSYFDTYRWRSEEDTLSPFQVLAMQSCLALLFVDRGELTSKEYTRIKNTSVSFRGKKSWPVFSEYSPGFVPQEAVKEEERIMQEVLEIIMNWPAFVKELKKANKKVNEFQIPLIYLNEKFSFDMHFYAVPSEWTTGAFRHEIKDLKPVYITPFEIERVKRLSFGDALWEMDIQYINQPMKEEDDERGAFPLLFLISHPGNKEVLETEVLFQQDTERMQRTLIQEMVLQGQRPPQIVMESSQASRLLPMVEKVLQELHIDCLVIDRLPFLSIVKHNLRAKLDGTEEINENT